MESAKPDGQRGHQRDHQRQVCQRLGDKLQQDQDLKQGEVPKARTPRKALEVQGQTQAADEVVEMHVTGLGIKPNSCGPDGLVQPRLAPEAHFARVALTARSAAIPAPGAGIGTNNSGGGGLAATDPAGLSDAAHALHALHVLGTQIFSTPQTSHFMNDLDFVGCMPLDSANGSSL